MTRPSHNTITAGLQGWDGTIDTNFDLVFTNPCPLAEFANKAGLPSATINDDSLAITVDDHTLWISDQTEWVRVNPVEVLYRAVGDETTAITTGTAKLTFRMPYAFKLTEVRASLSTAGSGSSTIDINESGTSVLSTKLTIDASEKTSETAAVPPVISDAALADDAEITIDIDVAGASAAGLKVTLLGYAT